MKQHSRVKRATTFGVCCPNLPPIPRGGYKWDADFRCRVWKWNSLLLRIRSHVAPALRAAGRVGELPEPNAKTLRLVETLLSDPGSFAVRTGRPPPEAVDRATGAVRSRVKAHRANPVAAFARVLRRLSDPPTNTLMGRGVYVEIVTLTHKMLACEGADAATIHAEMRRMLGRFDRWLRAFPTKYLPGAMLVCEIDRCRVHPGSRPGVNLHAHVLAQPGAVAMVRDGVNFRTLVQQAWSETVRDPSESDDAHIQRGGAINVDDARLRYLFGIEKPPWTKRGTPKILDGFCPPASHDGSAPADHKALLEAREEWRAKGRIRADQLYLILAGYTYPGQTTRWVRGFHEAGRRSARRSPRQRKP